MTSTHAARGFALAALFAIAGAAGVAPAALAQQAPVQQQPASSAGRLTTHVLDTLSGKPGAGIRISFEAPQGEGWRVVKTITTNADGRTDQPLLAGEAMAAGRYRIVFHVGEYLARLGVPLADPPFLDRVPVEFAIADTRAHYHVPLLVTPWSYATYRGS
jgi:5-hydroxyisourate hydrolase